jgi:AraC-like DNA-binding protein
MNGAAPDVATIRVSTDDLAPAERIPFFCDVFGRSIARFDLEPLGDGPFYVKAVLRALPGLKIGSAVNSGLRVERTRALIADGNDDVLLAIPLAGKHIVTHLGREVAIAAGEAVPMSNSDLSRVTNPDGARFLGVGVPRQVLASLVPRIEDAFMRPIPRGNEALRLLVGYLKLLDEDRALASPELRRLAVAHVHDLVALAIGASRDAAVIAVGRGVRAARLAAIKADIAAHLGHGDLTVGDMAARQRVTPRYVQSLFETEGTTFSRFMLAQRLLLAHRMLTDPRHAAWKTITIAHAAGFADLSYFNRAFRRHYGASPSDVREAAHKNVNAQ